MCAMSPRLDARTAREAGSAWNGGVFSFNVACSLQRAGLDEGVRGRERALTAHALRTTHPHAECRDCALGGQQVKSGLKTKTSAS
jgi:hypothetical protein